MEKSWKFLMTIVAILVTLNLVKVINAIESPQFTVIHSESDFEIRVYRNSTWMSASVNHLSFHQATKLGFHRSYGDDAMLDFPIELFQYIQGANLNFSRIPMTKPVLTSIVPGAGPLHSSAYYVRFYLPVEFQATPPLPLPELNLKPVSWPSHCIAVRKFPGYARDGNVVAEANKLSTSLGRSPWANSTSADRISAYSIAQYNSPFRFIGRVNEVWVNVDGSEEDNCMSSGGMATY